MQYEYFPYKIRIKVVAGGKTKKNIFFHFKTGIGAVNIKSSILIINLDIINYYSKKINIILYIYILFMLYINCMPGK